MGLVHRGGEEPIDVFASLPDGQRGFLHRQWVDQDGEERQEVQAITQEEVDALPNEHNLTILKDGIWNMPAA
jgi:hypothetical protein